MVKIDGDRLTKYAKIVVQLNNNGTYEVPYGDVLKLDCTKGYIKYLTYITVNNVITVTGELVLDIIY